MILKKQQKETKKLSSITQYSAMAFQMAAIIGLGVFGGIKLDRWIQLGFPVFTVICSLGAVFLALYFFLKDVMFLNRK